jgi:hypothetical protein
LASRPLDAAGHAASVDGRSNQLDLDYAGPTPGQTHVLALGVSKYQTQALRFADKDAEGIGAFLRRTGNGGALGSEPIVLVNEGVTQDAVESAFTELRRRARGQPEDTVVVFLAGHTDIRRELFCLLLPSAQLPAGPEIVALRGPVGGLARPRVPLPINDRSVLPYFMIYRNLSFLDALQRLVIIDACQAEAIFDDPAVRIESRRRLRRQVESESYPARTSYILATRRGEREPEASELGHGLLTYVLLRGMGGADLRPRPDVAIFQQYPTADLDRDGWIQTGELQEYARLTIPALSKKFPDLVLRGRAAGAGAVAAESEAAMSPAFDRSASFALIEAPPTPVHRGKSPVPTPSAGEPRH